MKPNRDASEHTLKTFNDTPLTPNFRPQALSPAVTYTIASDLLQSSLHPFVRDRPPPLSLVQINYPEFESTFRFRLAKESDFKCLGKHFCKQAMSIFRHQ